MRKWVSKPDAERIVALYVGGLSMSEVSQVTGWKLSTVSKYLRDVENHPPRRTVRLHSSGYALWGHSYVHRIVAEAWYGPIPDGHHVHHKNGDKLDNRPENLEILTAPEHAAHHVARVWTPQMDACLVACAEQGVPARVIADALCVSKVSVDNRRARLREARVIGSTRVGRRESGVDWRAVADRACLGALA